MRKLLSVVGATMAAARANKSTAVRCNRSPWPTVRLTLDFIPADRYVQHHRQRVGQYYQHYH